MKAKIFFYETACVKSEKKSKFSLKSMKSILSMRCFHKLFLLSELISSNQHA